MSIIGRRSAAAGLSALALAGRGALAQGGGGAPVKVASLLPLTGNAASAGASAKAALELATDLINEPHPDLAAMPLMATAGLPGLGGRKVQLVLADNQGNPSVGQNQALRLITHGTRNADRLQQPLHAGDQPPAVIRSLVIRWPLRFSRLGVELHLQPGLPRYKRRRFRIRH